jgi:hypothetical protein
LDQLACEHTANAACGEHCVFAADRCSVTDLEIVHTDTCRGRVTTIIDGEHVPCMIDRDDRARRVEDCRRVRQGIEHIRSEVTSRPLVGAEGTRLGQIDSLDLEGDGL